MCTTGVVAVLLLLAVMSGASAKPGRPPPFRTLLDLLKRDPPVTHLRDTEGKTHSRPEWRSRVERAAQQGCVLGTCQIHNLANMLYQIGKSNGKDESRRASDPRGYGR
ncbi:hypothetical protein GN956_G20446 [Arapaima gigas]